MAGPAEFSGRKLYIKVETAAGSGTFTHLCIINTDRGITWNSETTRGITPDCDNPGDPAWQWIEMDGLSASIAGAGSTNMSDIPFLDAWYRAAETKQIQVWVDTNGYWQGGFKLTTWDTNGARTGKGQSSMTIESDGEVEGYVVD